MLNGRVQQEPWPNNTMLVGCSVLPIHPSFRRLGDNHDVSRPRWARPGSVRPWHRLGRAEPGDHRDLLLQTLMGTGVIEVGDIGLEDASELLLMQDKQMIQTLPTHAP